MLVNVIGRRRIAQRLEAEIVQYQQIRPQIDRQPFLPCPIRPATMQVL